MPLTEFCQVQNSLCVQVLRSPILAALLHGTRARAVGVSQTAEFSRVRHLHSAGRPSRWASAHNAHILVDRYLTSFTTSRKYLSLVHEYLSGVCRFLEAHASRIVLFFENLYPEMTCCMRCYYKVHAKLSMGPFSLTQPNPTHQLTDPIQPCNPTSHKRKIWTHDPTQLTTRCNYQRGFSTTRALQPVATCRQSPYLRPAIITLTSFSL